MNKILVWARTILEKLGIAVIKQETLDALLRRQSYLEPFERWSSASVPAGLHNWVLTNMSKSKAQLQQDLFVSYFYPNPDPMNFFVEFGATNGISLSNTYFLESELNWNGILAEPGRTWHETLTQNRKCKIDFDCVFSNTGEVVEFSEVIHPELSTISSFQGKDSHSEFRKKKVTYPVTTVTLQELLIRNNSPKAITYLSIDTEGSEFEILENFPFKNWNISIISVEHNYTANTEKLEDLLTKNGFTRVLTEVSLFDSWYLSGELIQRFRALTND